MPALSMLNKRIDRQAAQRRFAAGLFLHKMAQGNCRETVHDTKTEGTFMHDLSKPGHEVNFGSTLDGDIENPAGMAALRAAQQARLAAAFAEFSSEAPGSVLEVKLRGNSPGSPVPSGPGTLQCAIESDGIAWRGVGEHRNLRLPIADGAFDWAACDSTIEYAGDSVAQAELLAELWRVARRGVFLTACNARHPFERFKALPGLGKLAPSNWILDAGNPLKGEPLLLDAPTLESFAELIYDAPRPSIGHIRFCGFKSRFFLMLRKTR